MDIKLKHKYSRPMQILFILTVGVTVCFALYYFVDTALNGTVINWFEENYMITESKYIAEAEQTALVREPNYVKIKMLVLWILAASVIFWAAVILITVHFYSKAKVRQSVTQISNLIHDFMNTDTGSGDIFPKEYAEISIQMTEIKTIMRKHEQRLKEEASRKNDLIAYLAHDLKTPLTSIIGYLSLLDEAPDMPAEQKAKYVHITLDKANRLEKLINEFFEITRYNLQQIQLEKETIDLYYMLVQMTDEFYPLLQSHGNNAELVMDESLTVYGDAVKLARVFNNILKNAIAYSYPGTTIIIRAQQKGTAVEIYFRNKGKTIPSHKLNAIFEKFFRLDEARTTNTGGAGLGLAIAKEIVSLHGGSITAESENEVTTFTVSLPLHD